MQQPRSLEELQARQYRYNVIADPEGGWVIEFPDLPGCLTQVDDPAEIGPMAEDAKREWIEAAHELGRGIPEPTFPELEEYSGKFVMRVPKKLHRELSEQAKRNGVSLNAWVTHLLTERSVLARIVA